MKRFSSVLFILLLMLASFTVGTQYPRGDVDYNGKVNVADVATLIDYLLTGTWEDEPVTPPDEHEYVDLGLPSGTLWATCNVGADNPEDYGDYFAWGETEPKEVYDWSTYKWCNGSETMMTKYCSDSRYGIVDGKTVLDVEDDAAFVNWGSSWRMPSKTQQDELREKCIWSWSIINGVNGYLVTGANGNSLFLPSSGRRGGGSLYEAGTTGYYLSRTHSYGSDLWYCAYSLYFRSGRISGINVVRNEGGTVRAVRVSQE